VFEFRQASEGLDRKYEGNGLGLSIAKKFVDVMGGRLYIKSELNKGSEFTLIFPLIEDLN